MTTPFFVRRLAAALAACGILFGLACAKAQVRDHRGDSPKYKTPTPSCPNGQCAPGTVIRDHRGGTLQVRVCRENSYNVCFWHEAASRDIRACVCSSPLTGHQQEVAVDPLLTLAV